MTVGWIKRIALKHVYYHMWNRSPVQVWCMRQGNQCQCTGTFGSYCSSPPTAVRVGVVLFSFISIFKNLSSWNYFARVRWGSCWLTVRLETYRNCGLSADLGQALGKVEAGGWKTGIPPGAGTDGAAGTCSGKQKPRRHHRVRSGHSNWASPLEKLLRFSILK